jgi:predicted kinase
VARLVLINGAPGSGKSTLAQLLAQDEPLAMAVDIDAIKHSLGQWRAAMPASGVAARRLAVAMASDHLRHGHDVLVAQFLARTDFIAELEALAEGLGVTWAEFVLAVNEDELRARLAARTARPQLPEHVVNNELLTPDDAGQLARSIEAVITLRPSATVIDANGTVHETAETLRRHLDRAR